MATCCHTSRTGTLCSDAFTWINGQKIAAVGYSHHREPQHEDRPGFTKWVVQRVIDGEQNGDSFLGPISKYFGDENKADFWSGVLFSTSSPKYIAVHRRHRRETTTAHPNNDFLYPR